MQGQKKTAKASKRELDKSFFYYLVTLTIGFGET